MGMQNPVPATRFSCCSLPFLRAALAGDWLVVFGSSDRGAVPRRCGSVPSHSTFIAAIALGKRGWQARRLCN